MKRSTRVTAALAVGAVSAAGLVACSGGGGDTGTDGPVTIRILEFQQTRADAIEKLIPAFEEEMADQGKEITVELVADILTDDQFKTKITQQFIAGEAPDLIDMGASYIPGFAGAGYLEPLTQYLDGWEGWDAYYQPIKDAMVQQDGEIYSLPHEAGVGNIFYRSDVLEDLGIDTSQPETWDDLLARLNEIHAATGEAAMVIPAGTSWGGGTWSEGFSQLLGGTDTEFYDAESGTWNLESPGFKAVFDLYGELIGDDLLPTEDLLNPNPWEPTKYVKFPEGTLPVAAQGTHGWKYDWGPEGATPIEDVEEKVATWDWPGLQAGDSPYSWLGVGFGYSIPATSEHKEAAAEFAKWLSSGEAVAQQLVAVGSAAVRDDVSEFAPYSDEPTLLDAEAKLETSVVVVTGDGSDQVSQAVASATEGILTGRFTGDQAYEAFVTDATDLLGPSLVSQ